MASGCPKQRFKKHKNNIDDVLNLMYGVGLSVCYVYVI